MPDSFFIPNFHIVELYTQRCAVKHLAPFSCALNVRATPYYCNMIVCQAVNTPLFRGTMRFQAYFRLQQYADDQPRRHRISRASSFRAQLQRECQQPPSPYCGENDWQKLQNAKYAVRLESIAPRLHGKESSSHRCGFCRTRRNLQHVADAPQQGSSVQSRGHNATHKNNDGRKGLCGCGHNNGMFVSLQRNERVSLLPLALQN